MFRPLCKKVYNLSLMLKSPVMIWLYDSYINLDMSQSDVVGVLSLISTSDLYIKIKLLLDLLQIYDIMGGSILSKYGGIKF